MESFFTTMNTFSFGALIRKQRILKRINGGELATKVGISPSYLSNIENDKNMVAASVEKLTLLAKELDINPDELIILAGRVPDDVISILQKNPIVLMRLLREVQDLDDTKIEELTFLATGYQQEAWKYKGDVG